MFKLTKRQRVEIKLRKKLTPVLSHLRRLMINNNNFSIISNNCWGGVVYEYYGIKKLSPTVGTFIMAEDYIKFIKNLPYYLSLDIKMITSSESKHYMDYKTLGSDHAPVGVLDDVEIVFLHYLNPNVAKAKWNSRVTRVNYSNMIFKFSYMNNCTDELIKEFDSVKFDYCKNYKKICFVHKYFDKLTSCIFINGHDGEEQISNDTSLFKTGFKLNAFINGKGLIQK